MEAKINIQFEEINGVKVDNNLITRVPQLLVSTEKTVKILTEQMEKYFKEKKIKIKTDFKISK